VTLVISVMHSLLVELAVAEAVASASVVVSAVSANADWNPAATSPPAATVPPVTARARRRLMVLSLWFPVMITKLWTAAVRGVSMRCAQGKNSQKAEFGSSSCRIRWNNRWSRHSPSMCR
jgi:hypothetical protein